MDNEINIKETMIELTNIIETGLNNKLDDFEKSGLTPTLTRTDIMLYFSRIYEEIENVKFNKE